MGMESQILVRLDKAEHDRLRQVAAIDGRPVANWARRAIMLAVDKASYVESVRGPDGELGELADVEAIARKSGHIVDSPTTQALNAEFKRRKEKRAKQIKRAQKKYRKKLAAVKIPKKWAR